MRLEDIWFDERTFAPKCFRVLDFFISFRKIFLPFDRLCYTTGPVTVKLACGQGLDAGDLLAFFKLLCSLIGQGTQGN